MHDSLIFFYFISIIDYVFIEYSRLTHFDV